MARWTKIFEKRLKKTDIHKRFAFPSRSLWSLPPFQAQHAQRVKVWDVGMERFWEFRCIIRKKGYEKPVFSKGWCKFVEDNKLVVGDKVCFFKVGDLYVIEVKRAAIREADVETDRVEVADNLHNDIRQPTGSDERSATAIELDTTLRL